MGISFHIRERNFNVSVPSFSFFNEKGYVCGKNKKNFVNL